MTFFDKIKDLGSRIIKPVIKPFNPAKLPSTAFIPIGGKDAPYPKKALVDNGGHSYVKPNGGIGWVSYK